jgi:hypothetical protein
MACRICEIRKPRRYCPGVRGDICSQCCGTEREMTVDCPLDCEYLRQARVHDRLPHVVPEDFPNSDIRVSERFLEEHSRLLYFLAGELLQVAISTPGAVDNDIKEALHSIIRTYRTLQSGLYYDSRPENPVAGAIYSALREKIDQFRKTADQEAGMAVTRDADFMTMLVFLQRLEIQYNNGRRRGRAFVDFLRGFFQHGSGAIEPAAGSSPLIVT